MAAIANAWVDETAWMPRAETPGEIETFIRAALPSREVWVAGDPVCGYLAFDPEESKVSGFYVARRGEGIGRALMERVKKGRAFLWLRTHVPNAGARRFYAREGFREVSRHAPEPPDTVEELRMEWSRDRTA